MAPPLDEICAHYRRVTRSGHDFALPRHGTLVELSAGLPEDEARQQALRALQQVLRSERH